MRFRVPKYINIEDKIFGPFTFKQFVYLVGGAGLCVIVYWLAPTIIAIPAVLFIIGFSLALAFWDLNGKPFLFTVRAAFSYLTSARMYTWKHRKHEEKSEKQINKELKQIEKSMANMGNDTINKKSVSVEIGKTNTSAEKRSEQKKSE